MHEQIGAFASPIHISSFERLSFRHSNYQNKKQNTCKYTCKFESPTTQQSSTSFKSAIAAFTACLVTAFSPIPSAKANQNSYHEQTTVTDVFESPYYSANSTHTGITTIQDYPKGTLLKVHPSPSVLKPLSDPSEGSSPSPATASRGSSSTLSQSAASFSEWASSGVSRGLRARRPSRFPSMRPTTLGLVGVGAVTSGSVMFRTLSKKSMNKGEEEDSESAVDVWSVICLHIPFCVSERALLLERLERLATTANITTPDGMAKATREAAAVLLGENGLLEDSRSFAPFLDVVVTESMEQARKRFSAHVEIEGNRQDRAETDVCENSYEDGDYGVVTMVLATTEGVDLHCYDKKCTVMKRLRCALDGVAVLRSGQVLGLELLWVPQTMTGTPLTKKQLRCEYPFLQIA